MKINMKKISLFFVNLLAISMLATVNVGAEEIQHSQEVLKVLSDSANKIEGKSDYEYSEKYKIYANDKEVDAQTVLYNSRTFLPIRKLSDTLGADINYDKELKIATIKSENIIIEVPIKYNKAVVNNVIKEIDNKDKTTSSLLSKGSTYLPVRFIAENLGYKVAVDGNIIKISKEAKQVANSEKFDIKNVPKYQGKPYIEINNNVPYFKDSELQSNSFENYSDLDDKGRCGVAFTNIGTDLLPTEKRGSIGSVKPSGWHTVKYDIVDGKYLYNRCHLIGYQLSGENANVKNLITGTRYMNVDGMLPFENLVQDYVEKTGNHVYYRVTPIFEGDNMVATGVLMEGKSVEDNGNGVQFNVFCYNAQPGIDIDYKTGSSALNGENIQITEPKSNVTEQTKSKENIVDIKSIPKKKETVKDVKQAPEDKKNISDIDTNGNGIVTISEAKAAGYTMPITSDHWLYPHMKDRDGDGMVGEKN